MTEIWINEYRDRALKNNVVSYLILHPNQTLTFSHRVALKL